MSKKKTAKHGSITPVSLEQGKGFDAQVQAVRELGSLLRQMLNDPSPEQARSIRSRASELEEFFAAIRRESDEVLQASTALASLARLVPPADPDPDFVASPPGVDDQALRLPGFVSALVRPGGFAIRPRPPLPPPPDTVTLPGSGGTLDGSTPALHDFFTAVSQSVISAQQELDKQSVEYARQQQGSIIPPALFSIPTVKAEVKTGFSSVTKDGIIMQLIRDTTVSNTTESTITFDIVASPPQPGRIDRFTTAIPRFLVIEGPDREEVLASIRPSAGATPLDAGWEDRAVVIRNMNQIHALSGSQEFVVFVPGALPAPGADGTIDFSHVALNAYLFDEPSNLTQPALPSLVVRACASIQTWLASVTAGK